MGSAICIVIGDTCRAGERPGKKLIGILVKGSSGHCWTDIIRGNIRVFEILQTSAGGSPFGSNMPHVELDTALPCIAKNSCTKDHGSHNTPYTVGEEGPLGKVIVLGLGKIPTQDVQVIRTPWNSATINRWIEEFVEFERLEHIQTARARLTF